MASSKVALRAELLGRRQALSPEDITAFSSRITDQLDTLSEVQKASHVAAYWPVLGEVDIRRWLMRVLDAKHHVYLPRYDVEKDAFDLCQADDFEVLVQGKFGVWEPPPTRTPLTAAEVNNQVEAWLVPGLAFDRKGNRIGLGKGYYDRLLAHAQGTKIGLAYDFQLLSSLPADPHDIGMDIVATPSEVICCN
ncbi:MAG: 5-formyltetrahydrofolate cyclo-ligase [Candidatus Margulisiibacteriota bacterium]